MEEFTVEQFQENFDALISRVENGESFIIDDDGKRVVIVPHKTNSDELQILDEFVKNNKNHDDAC
jgi:antitoxin (DNA-binding transcriptional repressor) of toxin-antitoxin stability system